MKPSGVASPCRWVSRSTSPSGQPGSDRRGARRRGRRGRRAARDMSSVSPPSASAAPAMWWPPPAHRQREAARAGVARARRDVVRRRVRLDHERGPSSRPCRSTVASPRRSPASPRHQHGAAAVGDSASTPPGPDRGVAARARTPRAARSAGRPPASSITCSGQPCGRARPRRPRAGRAVVAAPDQRRRARRSVASSAAGIAGTPNCSISAPSAACTPACAARSTL